MPLPPVRSVRPPHRRDLLVGAAALAAGGLAPRAATAAALTDPRPAPGQLLTRIALGSCLRKSDEGAVLDRITALEPDLMLWLGDNVYGDTPDPVAMRDKYARLTSNPRFQRLFARCPNLAIWDDHDFGLNNGGGDFPAKHATREVFFETWRIDPRSPRRRSQGIYDAFIAGPRGREVQIILLDNRFNRSQPSSGGTGTVLGEAQWRWLDAQLGKRAALRLIVSGIQIVNSDYARPEQWSDFPAERERLFALIRKKRATGVVFVSGDIHRGELNLERAVLGYDAYDLTSSALDQMSTSKRPGTAQLVGSPVLDPNYGSIEIDWDSADPVIKLQLHPHESRAPALSHWLRLSDLQPLRS